MPLWLIPMGVVAALSPGAATFIAVGMQAWLAAIPEEMW